MSVSMEERLQRRKLDALKRGIHRVTGGEALASTTHVVGIGRAGARAVAEILRHVEPDRPKMVALVVDIGDVELAPLRDLAATLPPGRVELATLAIAVPTQQTLSAVLKDLPKALTLEYPNYNARNSYQPWLPADVELVGSTGHARRAVAKALYVAAYYGGDKPMARALRAFASDVDAANSQAVVAVVFGLGGGTGSGIAVDLARHLSNNLFGRRVLVAGIGVAPCDGDAPAHTGAALFPVINELDCLGDEAKNRGVVAACGEMFRNPFTAGFVVVPQQHVWEATNDLAATQKRCDQEVASLLTTDGGAHLWELLRLLNWLAAPSTQHSAARTPWGAKWIHMLGFADAAGHPVGITPTMAQQLGLSGRYVPEFIELRTPNEGSTDAAQRLEDAFTPDVPPHVVGGGRSGSVQFILPSISKSDLKLFTKARDGYDAASPEDKLLDHAMLLEQGVELCEPSTQLEGMAGASLWGGKAWVAVALDALRGEDDEADAGRGLLDQHALGEVV